MKNMHRIALANNYWNPITGESFNSGLGYKPYRIKGGMVLPVGTKEFVQEEHKRKEQEYKEKKDAEEKIHKTLEEYKTKQEAQENKSLVYTNTYDIGDRRHKATKQVLANLSKELDTITGEKTSIVEKLKQSYAEMYPDNQEELEKLEEKLTKMKISKTIEGKLNDIKEIDEQIVKLEEAKEKLIKDDERPELVLEYEEMIKEFTDLRKLDMDELRIEYVKNEKQSLEDEIKALKQQNIETGAMFAKLSIDEKKSPIGKNMKDIVASNNTKIKANETKITDIDLFYLSEKMVFNDKLNPRNIVKQLTLIEQQAKDYNEANDKQNPQLINEPIQRKREYMSDKIRHYKTHNFPEHARIKHHGYIVDDNKIFEYFCTDKVGKKMLLENSNISPDLINSDELFDEWLKRNKYSSEDYIYNPKYLPFDDILTDKNDPTNGAFIDEKWYPSYGALSTDKLDDGYPDPHDEHYEKEENAHKISIQTAYRKLYNEKLEEIKYDFGNENKGTAKYDELKHKLENFDLWFHTQSGIKYPGIYVTKSKIYDMTSDVKNIITKDKTTVTIRSQKNPDLVIVRNKTYFRFAYEDGIYLLNISDNKGLVTKDGRSYCNYRTVETFENESGKTKTQYVFNPFDAIYLGKL